MGKINNAIHILETCNTFNIQTFIETGTGTGDAIKTMLQYNSQLSIHSIEIMEQLHASNLQQFHGFPNVHLHLGRSSDVLFDITSRLLEPTLFWLDAHYPGADYGLSTYDAEQDKTVQLPLEHELTIIKSQKDISCDVFVMDDLRIYEDGPFQNGNINVNGLTRREIGSNSINLDTIFASTHHVFKSYKCEGFILAFPNYISKEHAMNLIVV